ncbi:MAG: hypothetical protein ACK6CT_03165 [Planctomycetia bacterium]
MNARVGGESSVRGAGRARNAVTAFLRAGLAVAVCPPFALAIEARIEKTDGSIVSGSLESIGLQEVRLAALPAIPVAAIRRILVAEDAAAGGSRRVAVEGAAGLRLAGDDFIWKDGRAAILQEDGRIELPIDRVHTVAFRSERGTSGDPAWLGAIPEKPGSDLVVIARQRDKDEPGFELVECAITAVDAEQVSVVLDEETIRVNRGKVAGLHWLRPTPAEAEGTAVAVIGGGLRGTSVTWSPESLEIDGTVKLPGRMLRSIDYAAGRTVRLATLTAERTTVEPFFGGLATIAGLAEFFAPRFLPAESATPGGLVVRPRTVVAWRVPADSRRFRARLASTAAEAGGRTAVVTISVDDREVFRSPAADGTAADRSAAPGDVPIDVDVAPARRLTITVDAAGAGGPVGPVLFHDPVFEK